MLIHLHRAALLAVLTVALMATGFAHRMQLQEGEALAFALQNGVSISDFCGDPGKGMDPGTDCQACKIAGSADLPSVNGLLTDLKFGFHPSVIVPREEFALLRPVDPANQPQGPPVA